MHNNSWSMTLPLMLNRWLACARSSNTYRPSWWLTHFTSSGAQYHLRFCSNYSQLHNYIQHGCCRLLANGERILHMGCCHSFTPGIDSRHTSSHPWLSYRTSLHHILLFTFQSHTPSAIWWNTIWTFCDHTECKLWPIAITSRWRLWKWFRNHGLTHSIMKDTKNSSCLQLGTYFIWSRTCHTTKQATYSTQTGVQMTFIKFNRWHPPTPTVTPFNTPGYSEDKRGGRELLDSIPWWWSLDFWGNTCKNIMYLWTWFTKWVITIPMPLCKLSNTFLHRQSGFKWHFGLWGLYGHIQQWRHTRNERDAILRQGSGLIWTLFIN